MDDPVVEIVEFLNEMRDYATRAVYPARHKLSGSESKGVEVFARRIAVGAFDLEKYINTVVVPEIAVLFEGIDFSTVEEDVLVLKEDWDEAIEADYLPDIFDIAHDILFDFFVCALGKRDADSFIK